MKSKVLGEVTQLLTHPSIQDRDFKIGELKDLSSPLLKEKDQQEEETPF